VQDSLQNFIDCCTRNAAVAVGVCVSACQHALIDPPRGQLRDVRGVVNTARRKRYVGFIVLLLCGALTAPLKNWSALIHPYRTRLPSAFSRVVTTLTSKRSAFVTLVAR